MKFRLIIFAIALMAFTGLFTACVSRPGGVAIETPRGNASPVTANSTVAADIKDLPISNVETPNLQSGADNVSLLLRAEDYDKAIEDRRAALAASPADDTLKQKLADAYITRAWFYKSKRLTTYTLADLFKAVETAPNYYRAHYEIGRFHNNQWQFSLGLLDLNKALSLKPDFAPAYTERAYSYYKNQKYEQALADVNKSIELAPSDPRPYCTRSLIYIATGKPDLAIEDANKAIQIAPSDAPSFYNRGLVYAATGKPDLAIADFRATLSLSDDDLLTARAGVIG
ncbi:MAG: tetratricopeptide repeat protein [Chloroflexi bacterium]|nr:tetratricopeptide repeat protein [Chloroflexota bacterium]